MTEETPTLETAAPTDLSLAVEPEDLRLELGLKEPETVGTEDDVDPAIAAKADQLSQRILAIGGEDIKGQQQARAAVESMGRELQRKAAHRSDMLKQPMRALAHHSDDGGTVAKSLTELRIKAEELDPNRFDFTPGWMSRMVGAIPGVGSPLKRYFMRYESAQTIIDSIIRSLQGGAEQLNRDNITLGDDQRAMREVTVNLGRQLTLARLLDTRIAARAEREEAGDPARAKFLDEEILFPLRQRTLDLQQQLAVNQQGVLAIELIVRNNKELVRGVNRAIDVTVSALQVAVTVALALANQKIVLDKVEAINRTTSDLIAGTAERLRTQGTEIHEQASSAGLDLESLKSAFTDIDAAMTDIARYRREALPRMAASILEFDKLAEAGEQAIQAMEEGRNAQDALQLESR